MRDRQAGPSLGVEGQGKALQGIGTRQSTNTNSSTAQFRQFIKTSANVELCTGAQGAAHSQRCTYDSGVFMAPVDVREQTQLNTKTAEAHSTTIGAAFTQDEGLKEPLLAARPQSGSTMSFHTSYLVDEESLESTIKESLSILGELEDGDEQNFYGRSNLASRFASLDAPGAGFPAQARDHTDGQAPRDAFGQTWTIAEAAGDKRSGPGVLNVQKTEPLHISVERAIREAALACQASTGLVSKSKRRSAAGLANNFNRMREGPATPKVQGVRPAVHSYFSAVPQLLQPASIAPQHGQRQTGAKPGMGGAAATQTKKMAHSSHSRPRHLPKTVLLSHGRTAVLTGMPRQQNLNAFATLPLHLPPLPSMR